MKDGFLKAGAVSPKVTVAGIRANADRIIELVTQASEKRIKLLVFPEMCLTGYTIGDLVFSSDMLSSSLSEVERICTSTRECETLFIIDTIPYAASYQQAKAAVATAEAQMATAKLSLEGDEELYKEKVISDFQLQTTRNSYNTAVASLAQARAQEASAANNLSFAKVTSPVNGVAGMTSIRVGALVSAATTELISVTDNSQMYVYFSLPEKEVLSLTRQYGSIDNTVAAYPPVSLTLNDGSLYEQEGKIDVISRIVDKSTGTVSLRAIFANPDGRLMSGGSGKINIPYDRKGVIVIPQEATFEIQDKIFTYKVIDGKAVSTQIKVFKINDGKEYIVEEGLKEGDVIVAKGAGLLREGTPVAAAPATDGATKQGE